MPSLFSFLTLFSCTAVFPQEDGSLEISQQEMQVEEMCWDWWGWTRFHQLNICISQITHQRNQHIFFKTRFGCVTLIKYLNYWTAHFLFLSFEFYPNATSQFNRGAKCSVTIGLGAVGWQCGGFRACRAGVGMHGVFWKQEPNGAHIFETKRSLHSGGWCFPCFPAMTISNICFSSCIGARNCVPRLEIAPPGLKDDWLWFNFGSYSCESRC